MRGKPSASPRATREAKTIRRLHGQAVKPESLEIRLEEADLPAERPRRHGAFGAQERAALGVQHIVSRVAGDRAGDSAESRTCGKMRSMRD